MNNKLAKSVRLALMFGAASAAATSASVFAQDDEVERIEVTGSRIKQTDLEGANPVTVITREDMLATGITDVGDLIQRMPAMSGSPIGTTTNNGGNGNVTVNLRGMGSIRTLVLINGKRTVDGGDFQTVPAAMIKRIEILKDGASAVYGADAVSGVVNIITRDDFEGVQVEYQRSDSMEADAGLQETTSLITGKAFDGGNIVFGAEYTTQEEVYQRDYGDIEHFQHSYFITEATDEVCAFCDGAPYFDSDGFIPGETVAGFGSSRIPTGNFNFNPNSAYFPSGSATYDPTLGDNSDPNAYRAYNGAWFDPNNDSYNYAPVNFIQTPYNKVNVFGEGKFEISDSVSAFAAIRANHRESAQVLAPVPYDTNSDPGYSVMIVDADGNPVLDDNGNPVFNNGISADNYYNPFGEDIVRARRRMAEGTRDFFQDITQIQAVMGFEGEINDEWSWDLSYNYGHRSRTDEDAGQFYGPNLEAALGPSFMDANGNIVCGTPDAVIAGCVPLNLFGDTGTVTQEMLDYISVTAVDTIRTTQDQITGSVVGELFELPAGMVQAAFGYEYLRTESYQENDSGKDKDAITGNTGSGVKGAIWSNSFFTEIGIPLLDGAPMAEMLDMTVGLRYDDYNTFGSNTSYQVGLKWQPVDGLLVRATAGEVFRAPTVGELFSAQSDGFPTVNDPCRTGNWANLAADAQARCMAQGVPNGGYAQADTQVRARVGGNTELQPEEGDTLTVGVAWSPEFLDGFSMTVDYWSIELDEVISSLSAESTLELCIIDGIDSECSQVHRRVDATIDFIGATTRNLAAREAEGIDTEFNYSFETSFGEFKASMIWTHLLTREDTDFPGDTARDMIGTHDADLGETFAEDKINASLDWYYGDLTVSYLAEYISEIEAETTFWGPDYMQQVDSQLYHDIAAAYTFDFGTSVSVGVTNFTNEEPPYIDLAFNASTDPSTYRMFGRSYYLRVTQTF